MPPRNVALAGVCLDGWTLPINENNSPSAPIAYIILGTQKNEPSTLKHLHHTPVVSIVSTASTIPLPLSVNNTYVRPNKSQYTRMRTTNRQDKLLGRASVLRFVVSNVEKLKIYLSIYFSKISHLKILSVSK